MNLYLFLMLSNLYVKFGFLIFENLYPFMFRYFPLTLLMSPTNWMLKFSYHLDGEALKMCLGHKGSPSRSFQFHYCRTYLVTFVIKSTVFPCIRSLMFFPFLIVPCLLQCYNAEYICIILGFLSRQNYEPRKLDCLKITQYVVFCYRSTE